MIEPSRKQIIELTGISRSHASLIMRGLRNMPINFFAHIFKHTGWKAPRVSHMDDEFLVKLADYEPWVPRADR